MTDEARGIVSGESDCLPPYPGEVHPNPVLAIARGFVFFFWTLYCVSAVLVARGLSRELVAKRERSRHWTHRWLKRCVRIVGVEVAVFGESPPQGVMLTPNHLGYLDIVSLGSVYPTFFVAKAEIESWPFFGFLFRAGDHIGIARNRRRDVLAVKERIRERLEDKQTLCVFLEGTSTGGNRLLPFHSSLLQPGLDAGAHVVPVALAWRANRPGLRVIDDVAYWGGHVFLRHLWRVMGLRGIAVDIRFGDPIDTAGLERRDVAGRAREQVAAMLQEMGVQLEEE